MSQLVRLEGKYTWQNAHCALWGHRLPVTALALFARGLDNYIILMMIENNKRANWPICEDWHQEKNPPHLPHCIASLPPPQLRKWLPRKKNTLPQKMTFTPRRLDWCTNHNNLVQLLSNNYSSSWQVFWHIPNSLFSEKINLLYAKLGWFLVVRFLQLFTFRALTTW